MATALQFVAVNQQDSFNITPTAGKKNRLIVVAHCQGGTGADATPPPSVTFDGGAMTSDVFTPLSPPSVNTRQILAFWHLLIADSVSGAKAIYVGGGTHANIHMTVAWEIAGCTGAVRGFADSDPDVAMTGLRTGSVLFSMAKNTELLTEPSLTGAGTVDFSTNHNETGTGYDFGVSWARHQPGLTSFTFDWANATVGSLALEAVSAQGGSQGVMMWSTLGWLDKLKERWRSQNGIYRPDMVPI